MSSPESRLRVLFSSPAYWPALAFGGPVWMARELNERMTRKGHRVDVVTTTLVDIDEGVTFRTRTRDVDGVSVRYLATPVRYRWMGVTPSAPVWLRRIGRPDVAHVFGFRDPLGTTVAASCRARGIPYVLEPLGMLLPRVRKVRLKRVLDASALRWVVAGAAAIVVTSEHERRQAVEAGAPPELVVVRGNGFPPPDTVGRRGILRRMLRLDSEPLVLYVGRIASGKGIELLLQAVSDLDGVHLALVGPDDRHGVEAAIAAATHDPRLRGRVHRLSPDERPLDLYADADVFALPSAGESFGMVAAEAAAAGVPVVVTDRCGVAEPLSAGGALVVPYEAAAIRDAIARVLDQPELRASLSRRGREIAADNSWDVMAERQEAIYREVLRR